MKKRVVLLLLIAIFLAIQSVQAGLVFNNQELTTVLQEVADIKGEKLIFIGEPDKRVTLSVDLDSEFPEILNDLLTGSGYRAVAHGSYYLIGRFSHDSAEFASQSETFFYQAEYLSPEELAEKLDMEELRVRVLDDRNELLIQGLPADIKTAREKLAAIDVADNLYQVQYDLVVIDITEESSKNINLSEVAVSSEQDDGFEFLYADGSLEFLTSEIINQIAGTAERTRLESLSIARPSIIIEVGSTGYLNMSEEVLSWDEAGTIFQEIEFSTELTPYNITGGGEIETGFEFLVGSGTDFSTTVRLPAGETELLGLLKISEDKANKRLTGKSEYQQERTYAIYLSAGLAGAGPAARLGGLDSLIFQSQSRDYKPETSYFQMLADSQLRLDLDFQFQDELTGNLVEFKTRSGISHLEFSVGLPIVNGLSFNPRAVISDYNQLSLLLGLVDSVEIIDNLELSAGLYPLIFSFNQAELLDYAGFGEISYKPAPLIFNLRYSHNLVADPLRFETGIRLKNLPYLMVAATGDLDGLNRLLFGLRLKF